MTLRSNGRRHLYGATDISSLAVSPLDAYTYVGRERGLRVQHWCARATNVCLSNSSRGVAGKRDKIYTRDGETGKGSLRLISSDKIIS